MIIKRQKEFGNRANKLAKSTREAIKGLDILKEKGIKTDKITNSGVASIDEILAAAKQASRKTAREIKTIPGDINSRINIKSNGSLYYGPSGAGQRRLLGSIEDSGRHLKYTNSASKRGNIKHNPYVNPDHVNKVSAKNGAMSSYHLHKDGETLNKWRGEIESIESRKEAVKRNRLLNRSEKEFFETRKKK